MRAIRSFFRHIRDGFRNLFRNGLMTLVSIFTMTLTLIMIGSFVLIWTNINEATRNIEQTFQVRVMIDRIATAEEEATLKTQIQGLEHVTDVVYRSKDEELEHYKKTITSDFDVIEGDKNPLNNVYVVSVDKGENLDKVAQDIRKLAKVEAANYGSTDVETILGNINAVRIVLAVLASIFVVFAVLLVSNTIRLTILARRTEIEIMRLVGATKRYIRAPFKYEGAYIGLISGLLAFGALYGIYEGAHSYLPGVLGLANLQLVATMPIMAYVGAGLLVIGIVLGRLGAGRSIRRFLDI
ncbi:permease-like cell division protein FtsX [uncultured Abiotrophia sp.]|uniref:permease-like cell division protein FtsX n=1 Tax=uncultured Abiotrophia sp. TaxID=316094 RepID=UPI0028DBEB76|nr:permease-like cell division protein FtsX [uncultured Abiotrophia sp.]